MERKNSSTLLLPQDLVKSAERFLVSVAAKKGKMRLTKSEIFLSPASREFKSKKLKSSSSSSLSNAGDVRRASVVLPSAVKFRRQKIIRLPSQDDLWKSIKSNYYFLMDNNLIDECHKTRKELCTSSSLPTPVVTQQPISFPEFIERFNALHDRLHLLLVSLDDSTKQHSSITEMDLLGGEYSFLCNQGSILQRLDPELKDDVGRRCTILRNKWDVLVGQLWPKKKEEQDQVTKNLTAEIRSIRKWLREVEEKLRKLKVCEDSSPEDIRNIYNKEKDYNNFV